MLTPQEIEQISFSRATFGGYDMQSVDEFLEPLTEDYVTLYKENALLKSKMRVLVTKLEEYRQSEASMKDAIVTAQKTCDMMVKEAEVKCTQMLTDANSLASENAKNADAQVEEENARVEEARRVAATQIEALEAQLRSCLDELGRIKNEHRPVSMPSSAAIFDYDSEEGPEDKNAVDPADAIAEEISSRLKATIGSAEDVAPKAAPQHPVSETTTSKFTNLQFGPNYDPTHK